MKVKKILFAITILFLTTIIFTGCNNTPNNPPNNPTDNPPVTPQIFATPDYVHWAQNPPTHQQGFFLDNGTVWGSSWISNIRGNVTNNTTTTLTVKIRILLYNDTEHTILLKSSEISVTAAANTSTEFNTTMQTNFQQFPRSFTVELI